MLIVLCNFFLFYRYNGIIVVGGMDNWVIIFGLSLLLFFY